MADRGTVHFLGWLVFCRLFSFFRSCPISNPHFCGVHPPTQVQRLSWFANWFDSLEEPPTAIIDGPNAAYMDQNHKHGGFTLMQARALAGVLTDAIDGSVLLFPCPPQPLPTLIAYTTPAQM